ncbi:MAG: 6-phosphogluconolactonase [Hyphomonadaceae bacterium]
MTAPSIEMASSRAALAALAADEIAAALRAAIAAHGRASFAAAGGSTPGETYDALSRAELDWAHVDVTLTDERWVDVRSPQSNERMLRERLLVHAARAACFTPLKGRRGGVEDGAKAADRAVRALAPFDVTLLGVGEDGHFASLFPGHAVATQGLDPHGARFCIAVAPASPAPDLPRVSLTLAALLQSALIVVLATGEAKRRVIEAPGDTPLAHLFKAARTPVRVLWAA